MQGTHIHELFHTGFTLLNSWMCVSCICYEPTIYVQHIVAICECYVVWFVDILYNASYAIHMLVSYVCWGTADSTMNCLCSYNAIYLSYRFLIGYIQFIYDLCKTFSYGITPYI